VLYHGGLFPHRGIEQLMDAIRTVPDATLVLMGYGVLEPALRDGGGPNRGSPIGSGSRRGPSGRAARLGRRPPDVVAMPIQPSDAQPPA
jgi:hypothetical protein